MKIYVGKSQNQMRQKQNEKNKQVTKTEKKRATSAKIKKDNHFQKKKVT